MPPKGYKKPRPLTAEDYDQSYHFMSALLQLAEGLAKRHQELPRMSVLLTIARDAEKELSTAATDTLRQEQADQRPSSTPLSPDTDRPGEERS